MKDAMKKRANDRAEVPGRRDDSPDPAKRLPHERDESNDPQEVAPRRVTKQAHDDLKDGLVDTDERGVEAAPSFTRAVEGGARKRNARPSVTGKRKRPGP
jgi:hypothetical protein